MRARKFTEEQAVLTIKDTKHISIKSVLRALGASDRSGTNYAVIRSIAKKFKLDTTHWKGFGHAKGRAVSSLYKTAKEAIRTWAVISSHTLKLKLIRDGIKKAQCEGCGLTEWQAQPAPLELHHMDGNRLNNDIQNLQILCPNCHAQTSTYCSRQRTLRGRKRN